MYGGGIFTSQTKTLPGVYINVQSKPTSEVTTSTGVCAIGMQMDWCADKAITIITAQDFKDNSLSIIGYDSDSSNANAQKLREIFKNAVKCYVFKVNGNCVKATCTYATAKYGGTRGNALSLLITDDVDVADTFDVTTYLDGVAVDYQKAVVIATVEDNDWVVFGSTEFVASATEVDFSGGTQGDTVDVADYNDMLTEIASINDINIVINDVSTVGSDNVNALFSSWLADQRDNLGRKLQLVVYNYSADYEGVIDCYNSVNMVYWIGGALAGCQLNTSIQGKIYDGEFTIAGAYTSATLALALEAGKMVLQKDNDNLRVLDDINSLTTFTEDKNSDFHYNQTIRALDYLANTLKDKFVDDYLGKIQNNSSGRASFRSDIITILDGMVNDGYLSGYDKSILTVVQGDTPRVIVVNLGITPPVSMSQAYITILVG